MLEFLKTEHGIFTNNEELNKTATEVYQEWLNTYFDFIDGQWVPKQIDILPTKTLEEQIAEIYQKINANTQANESLAQYVSDLEIQLYEGGAL